jgi:hypothetical protein
MKKSARKAPKTATRKTAARKPAVRKRAPRIQVRMSQKRLVDLKAIPPGTVLIKQPYDKKSGKFVEPEEAFELDDFGRDPEDKASDQPPRPPRPRQGALAAVVGATFDAAVSRKVRRRLAHGQALAVVVTVPTGAWVGPVTDYFKHEFGNHWALHSRDGSNRGQHKAEIGSGEVARDLARGLCVAGVSSDPKMLPAALVAAADITVRLTAPTGRVLQTAIQRFTTRSPRLLPDSLGAGLDLHEIAAAFRPGSGPQKIVERLMVASARTGGPAEQQRVPDLNTAVEYGAARTWGLQLARSVADYLAADCPVKKAAFWRDTDRGICLFSKPGLGKTLYAQVLSRACGVPLIQTSVGEMFAAGPGYLDSVIKAMRNAFSRAAALAPCILFIDEIDAMPDRETLSERGRDWWTPVVNDFLMLLDSTISQREGVVVIGATNAINRVDKALLRPGRLEKAVEIRHPDLAGATNILRFHLDAEFAQDDLSEVGLLIEGSTGAEIMHMVRTARRTARHDGRAMMVDDLKRAALPPEDIPAARLFRMAVHEAAHAVIALAIPVGIVKHIVLRSCGHSGGQTAIDYSEFALPTRTMIEDRVVVALAARAAELLLTGAMSVGGGGAPDSDIGFSTALIAGLHASFGLGDDLVYLGAGDELRSELSLNRDLRDRVEAHLRGLDDRASTLVAENREAILAVAERLALTRFVSGDEIRDIVRNFRRGARKKANGTEASQ